MPELRPKPLWLFLLGLSLMALPVSAFTPAPKTRPENPPAQQAQIILERIAADYPGLSATVFVKGKAVWSAQTGYADSARRLPVTPETRFNIYSTSKAVTGLAFARLIQQGRVSLEDRVGDIAPELPVAWHPIRLKHILSHTSGVRHYTSPQDWLTFAMRHCASTADVLSYFANDPLVHTPGASEHYSTFAFVLASHLLTRITGEADFATAINRTLGTGYVLDRAGAVKSVAYIEAGQLPEPPLGASATDIVPLPIDSAECKFGGGGLLASSHQLAETGAALAGGQIIPKRHLARVLKPWSEVSGVVYGGGVRTINHAGKPVTTYSLSGGAPGGRSYLLVLIEPQISVAITGNIDGLNLEETAHAIARLW